MARERARAASAGYRLVVADLNRFSKAATDAGIAERSINTAERMGEQVALVCEEGLATLAAAGVALSIPQRTAYAEAIELLATSPG